MLDTIRLRKYLAGDLDALFRLDEICFTPPFRFSRAMMKRFAEQRNAIIVLAEDTTKLAGFSIVHVQRARGGTYGYVVTLDVAPEFRRRDVASLLMQEIERQARDAGCEAMSLHVFTGNMAALRFYEREGYVFVREAPDFYGPGVHGLIYQKQLA